MILEILAYPDPRLALKAEEIKEITPEIKTLAADMLETMYENEGIGLAAPQIGRPVRLVVMDLSGPEKREAPQVFINPTMELLGEKRKAEEGCLSVPGYRNEVPRYEKALLKAVDLEGNPVEAEAEDLFSICIQHECDHLEGVLFIDRIGRLKRGLYDSRLKKRMKMENKG